MRAALAHDGCHSQLQAAGPGVCSTCAFTHKPTCGTVSKYCSSSAASPAGGSERIEKSLPAAMDGSGSACASAARRSGPSAGRQQT